MKLKFDDEAVKKISEHLNGGKKLLLTFEDGVGQYSQHAMIHMMVQFTINIIAIDAPMDGYDTKIESNLGDVWIKGYSAEDLDENLELKYNPKWSTFNLSGDIGMIDDNVGFIDFTKK